MVRPWSRDIDDIILRYFIKEQDKRRLSKKYGIPVGFDPVKKSYTQLQELVKRERKKRKKGLGPETFADHLYRLTERYHILAKYPKGKRQVYGFDRDTYLEIITKGLNLSPEELDRRLLKIKHGL